MFSPKIIQFSLKELKAKVRKAKTVLNSFIGIVNESKIKPNKLWVDQGREFYNKVGWKKCKNGWTIMIFQYT